MDILNQFRNYLLKQGILPSVSTVKNYLADIRHFQNWFSETYAHTFDTSQITIHHVQKFISSLQKSSYSQTTIDRHTSSLRKFFEFLKNENIVPENPFDL